MQSEKKYYVHQIFYDERTKSMIDKGFIPLDNTANERPDWFEFWVIRNFLINNSLDEDAWYGFFSPKFHEKTGLGSKQVIDFIDSHSEHSDVAIFSPHWEHSVYFKNPFEQGDFRHPGLMKLSQYFFDYIGRNYNLSDLVSDSTSTVFCNYIVAKPDFWREWLRLANIFFELVENELQNDAFSKIRGDVVYLGADPAPYKTFIQERFASLILTTEFFRVAAYDMILSSQVVQGFRNNSQVYCILATCEYLKCQYRKTGKKEYIDLYVQIKQGISLAG
jgi:hypothetical protein